MNKYKTVLLAALCAAVLVCGSCGSEQETTPSTPSGALAPASPHHADPMPNTGVPLPGGFVLQRASWGSVQDPKPEEVSEPDITSMSFEAGQRLINQRKAAKRLKNMEIFIRR